MLDTPIAFAGAALDLAENQRSTEKLTAFSKHRKAYALIMFENGFVVDAKGDLLTVPPMKSVGKHLYDPGPLFLGLDGNSPVFAFSFAKYEEATQMTKGGQIVSVRDLASRLPVKELGLVGRAKSLFEWHRFHKFCATCGNPSEVRNGGVSRRCPACSTDHFPRVNPVVIMLVHKGDKCLLGRGPTWPEGYFSTLAGFVSPGESLAEACIREVKEEVNIDVINPEYQFSQPWPFPSQLMMGLFCEAITEEITIDPKEVVAADWFDKATVRAVLEGEDDTFFCPPKFAISHQLMKRWVES